MVVSETPDGWFRVSHNAHTPPALLSSVRCIVDRVVCFANKEPIYQGRVLIRDENFPFFETETACGHGSAAGIVIGRPVRFPCDNDLVVLID